MATPDHVTEHFEDTTETVEVRGDFVVLTIETRFGEPLLENSMSVEEAINLATRIFDAAATIYRRQPVANPPPQPTSSDPIPDDLFREVDPVYEVLRSTDITDPGTGRVYRKVEQPAPEADFGWADAAPKLAASA